MQKSEARPEPVWGVLSRFQEFILTETASGAILLVCTILALLWANSAWAASYFELWHTQVSIGAGKLALSMDLHHWINDGLMVFFFFLVGLEIKRELLVGELSQLRQAMLPLLGALGGMLLPALLYFSLNINGGSPRGWGIPVATDIAFALAVLALLGPRVPTGLKVFLLALSIADDLGAVLVIAIFYTHDIKPLALAIALGGIICAALLNRAGVVRVWPYLLIGVVVWLAVLLSGVHATVAGVLLALCIPARSGINLGAYLRHCRKALGRLDESAGRDECKEMRRLSGEQQELVASLESASERVQPPLDRLEHVLHPWIAFCVMPLFALCNAGVNLAGVPASVLLEPVSLGVILGLLLGKPIGVSLFAWLSVRFRFAQLPEGVSWSQIFGVSWICGVGFTMSLFISDLAFSREIERLDEAKLGILLASLLAGLSGYILLRRALTQKTASTAAKIS